MPLTLYWYILRDLLKLLALSTAVLVFVFSFGFAIKPISEGLLSAGQVLRVIAYAAPGMMVFVLPFTAALSSTLVFFRLVTDSEITACAASGISYRQLLTPVFALGLTLSLTMFYLSNWVVPRAWRLVEQQIEQDVTQLIVQQIQREGLADLGNGVILYADRAQSNVPVTEERPAGVPMPDNRMVFDGVAVGKMDFVPVLDDAGKPMLTPKGKPMYMTQIQSDYTAERAVVDIYRDDVNGRTYATMMLLRVAANDPQSDHLVFIERQPIKAFELPSLFEQKAKFLSLPRLRELAAHPEESRRVRDAKRHLVDVVAAQDLIRSVFGAMKGHGELMLTTPQGERYYVTAPGVKLAGESMVIGTPTPADAPATTPVERDVLVQLKIGGLVTREMKADWGELRAVRNDLDEEPRMNLTLKNVVVTDRSSPTAGALKEVTLPLLQWGESLTRPLREMSIDALGEHAAMYPKADEIKKQHLDLDSAVDKLMRDITSLVHERAAMATLCLLVLLLGALMSMLLRYQPPLAIFFWCFVPTIATFMAISRGQSLMTWRSYDPMIGMVTIWTGVAALGVALLVIYARLSRN
ncbi:MAG: LptF/LptG family permease [Phycisphaera sp.]|nr:LptF/LptG family permease [Phycisphaera sp.]